MLTTLLLALGAAPASASDHHYHLHTLMANASATSSRQRGGCTVAAGSHSSLSVRCPDGHAKATLVYTFSTGGRSVVGRAWGWAYAHGHADVDSSITVTGHTIRLTVTVSRGTASISSVCVRYYAN